MAIRYKLISPTNLLLEHPMLSPVKEDEYIVLGVKEWKEQRFNERLLGALSGAAIVAMMAILIIDLFFAATRSHAQGKPIPRDRGTLRIAHASSFYVVGKMSDGRRIDYEYSMLIQIAQTRDKSKDPLICERAYGIGSTPDIPWTLGKDHTWLECWDMLQHTFGPDQEYLKESVLRDFMQGPTFMIGRPLCTQFVGYYSPF